jgi:uncharacterized protein
MLARLTRWLRAAGHDTEFAGHGIADGVILARAHAEQRWLITRDRGFVQRRGAERVVLLSAQTLDEQARDLRERLALDWLHDPFSRCLLCNSPLREAPAPRGELRRYCPHCDKLYWEGGHVRRMRARLHRWHSG